MAEPVIVVPCYNEAQRLCVEAFIEFTVHEPSVRFIFVDDGSRDETREVLSGLERQDAARFAVITHPANRGKAEAVRTGMQAAFAKGPAFAGYWDADLSTPLDEIPRFVEALERHPECQIAMGARLKLLGRRIERSALRHYVGRVFATAASSVLRLPVYDTQCGAKLFRVDRETRALFDAPFATNWTFDVEVIARLLQARRASGGPPVENAIRELPLREWRDVPGSQVRPIDFVLSLFDLLRIWRRYLRR